ncbi:hypothetical protein TrVE_jg7203 [Triparma verrucosa]|uniref:Transmembrane protein n=2 Tax=Triparma TaxID=722752 RepID=A0A9W7A3G7_9STRA|nr:hypothetical protein TrST_g7549 [Triparma strigata]GMI01779.1 hypothetical protein TrVE_jg7203 [Triparma verrucosa]
MSRFAILAPTRMQRTYLVALVLGLLLHSCILSVLAEGVCEAGEGDECFEDVDPPSDDDGASKKKSKSKRKRRKLSLSSNIMQDLGLDDEQKLIVAMVFLGLIILPRFFGFDTRPKSRFGDVVHRQRVAAAKKKQAAEAARKKFGKKK